MKKKYLTLLLFCLSFITVNAQIPANDYLQNAINISTAIPFLDASVQTQNATNDTNTGLSSCGIGSYTKIYYKYTPNTNVSLNINLVNSSSNSFIIPTESSVSNPTSMSDLTMISGISCSFRESLYVHLASGKTYIFIISNPDKATNIQFYKEDSADIIAFADVNFKNALVTHSNPVIDTNGDGEIQRHEAFLATKISAYSKSITDTSGLEFFESLNELNLSNNEISSIDLSRNTVLNKLELFSPYLTDLNTYNNILLEDLSCSGENLTTIDLSKNTAIKKFTSSSSSLTDLDVSNNILLEELSCSRNKITNIDLSNNVALKSLYIYSTSLTKIDVSNNSSLEKIWCSSNKLTSLILGNHPKLTSIDSRSNKLTNIDVSNSFNLEYLNVYKNNLTSLDVSKNINLKSLNCSSSNLNDVDISNNANLEYLSVSGNNLSSVDISNNTALKRLFCDSNNFTSLNISNNLKLTFISALGMEINNLDVTKHSLLEQLFLDLNNNTIDISNNLELYLFISQKGLSSIDFSKNSKLRQVKISNSFLTTIDFSNNSSLLFLQLFENEFLKSINYKNGNNSIIDNEVAVPYTPNSGNATSVYSVFHTKSNPNLNFICVDDINYAINKFTKIDSHTTFKDNCTNLEESNRIIGKVLFDENNNGCTLDDLKLNNVLLNATDGTINYGTFTNIDGGFTLNLNENTYTTELLNIPSYYTINPASLSTTFTGFNNEEMADFCVTANQTVNDLNIVLLPITEARPGFDADYQLVYENAGTTVLSGTIELQFNNNLQSFVSSIPKENNLTSNTITFNYADLKPFEKRTINVTLNTFTPPTVNDGDLLNLVATITPITGDYTETDNVFSLNQSVVNSFDPNDKQVLQGEKITPSQTSEYLDYLIRFQNTGSASAVNVILTDLLDEKLDWKTLKPISSSHNYSTEIINNNFLKFTFNDINLPSEQVNEPESHGFIAFKIKPKTDIVVGDIITGKAKIYFDYNLPIITNNVATEVVNTLSIKQNNLTTNVAVFPNPVNDVLIVKNDDNLSIHKLEIYTINGKKITEKNTNINKIDFKKFDTGIYFIKFFTDKGILYKKVLKK